MTAEPVAVEGRDAVVRLEVRYRDPVAQEYRDLWVLRFAPDGRVEDFEEWAVLAGQAVLRAGADVGPADGPRVTSRGSRTARSPAAWRR